MNQLNLALTALLRGITSMRHPRLMLPVALLTAGQLVMLGLLVNFHQPPFVGLLAPFIRATSGDAALHYPVFFLALPGLFTVANLFLTAVLGAYIWGVSALAIASHPDHVDAPVWSTAASRYLHLLLAQLPVIAVAVAFIWGPRLVFGNVDLGGNNLRVMIYGVPLLFMILQAMFLFAPMRVSIDGQPAGRAIRDSLVMWRSSVFTTFLIVLVPAALHFPVQWVLRERASLAERFSFETIALIMAADVLLFLVTNFVLVTAATVAYQARSREL